MDLHQNPIFSQLTLTIGQFIEDMESLPTIDITDYSKESTLVVMIDMINGFAKFGPLSSPNVDAMIPRMGQFLDQTIHQGIPVVSYRDAHQEDAEEFGSFPPHCVSGSEESKLVDELERDVLIDITKNSTNGFLATNPLELVNGPAIQDIFVMGCVTDICVRDFATTLNKYLQETNQKATVYVIENLVDTYHIEGFHDRDVEHTLALYAMKQSGIQLVRV